MAKRRSSSDTIVGSVARSAPTRASQLAQTIPFEILPYAAILADSSGRIVSVNRPFETMFGHAAASVIGKPVEMLIPESFRDHNHRPRPAGATLELFGLHADGTEFPVEIALAPFDTATGRMTVAAIRDISGHKQMKSRLRESEQQYRDLTENSPEMVWQIDAALRLVNLSAATARLLGYARKELVGQPLAKVFSAESVEAIRKVAGEGEANDANADVKSYQLDMERKDGSVFPAEILARPVRDSEGQIVGYQGLIRDVTERKAAEEALRRCEEHLALTQKAGRIGSAEIDLVTGRETWSKELFRLLSLDSATTATGIDPVLSVAHPDDREALRRSKEAVGRGTMTQPFEFRTVCPERSERWLLRTTELIRDVGGAVRGHFVTCQDITERKLAEIAQRRSEAKLLESQSIAHLGSWELDLVNNKLEWSDEIFRIFGVEPRAFGATYEAFLGFVHPDDRAALDEEYSAAVAGERPYNFEHRIIRASDGEARWVHERCEHERDASGQIIRSIGTVQDITERKVGELELARRGLELSRQRAHLALAQRVGSMGSSAIDLKTGLSQWSEQLYALLGQDPAIVTPGEEAVLRITHPADVEKMRDYRARWLRCERQAPTEFRILRPTGEVGWIGIHGDMVYASDGSPETAIAAFLDITNLKREQEERVSLEQRLYQSKKLDAIGQLAGGVAHDFNNLLAVILGALDMAEGELADKPRAQGFVQSAARAAEHGLSLTKMMLAFARAQPLAREEVNPSAVVCEMTNMLGRLLGETVEVKALVAPHQWLCEADAGQLENALLNLSVNARDAMPNGGKLTIETKNVYLGAEDAAKIVGAKAGEYVVISVTDTGTGMPPEIVARAFEPFFTTKEVGRGTGLGLSMVNGFVRQSGGYVTIESEVGRGTTVRIHLPRKIGEVRDQAASVSGNVQQTLGESILVVEDNDALRELTKQQIECFGYNVHVAANAVDELVVLQKHPEIKLVLSDIVLPGGIDGMEAFQRALELRPGLKVVFMTGYTERSELANVGTMGRPRLLRKPFKSQQLARAIRATLDEG